MSVVAPACDLDNACTEIAVASVSLQVVSAEDETVLEDAEVRFTIDDGSEQEPDDRLDDGVFVLDFEETGVFAVTVSAPGHETVMTSYDVVLDEDGCHPVGQSDTIALAVAE